LSANREALEEELYLRETLNERRKDDPLYQFTPHKKQEAFKESVLSAECDENWLCSANRFGKSQIGAYCGSHLARFGLPNKYRKVHTGRIQMEDYATAGWVIGVDHNTVRGTIQPKYFDNGHVAPGGEKPFIPKSEIKRFDKETNTLFLKNGSLIEFRSCESETTKFQGAGKDWIHFDEEPKRSIYDECSIRVEAGRPLLIFGTCTILPPEGMVGGVSWLYSDIIQPFKQGKLKNIQLFGGSIYDNPHIPVELIAKLEAKYPPDSQIGRIRLKGEWLPGIGGAIAFTSFNRDLNVKPVELNPIYPLAWMFDFNVEPFATEVGQRIGDNFYLKQELKVDIGGIDEMCDLFYQHYSDWPGDIFIYGDATGGWRHSQTAKSSFYLVSQNLSRLGMNYRMKIPERNPFGPDRIAAINRACRDHDGARRLIIDPSCEETIKDLEEVLIDSSGGIKKTHNKKDSYFYRTHFIDGVSYWIAYEKPVRKRIDRLRRKVIPRNPRYG